MNAPKPNPNLFKPREIPENPGELGGGCGDIIPTLVIKPKKRYVPREHLTQRPFKELGQVKFWGNPNNKAV